MVTSKASGKDRAPRGSLWVLAGLLIILFVIAVAALSSTEDQYDICRAGLECLGAGFFFGWIFAGPLVAVVSIVGLVRAAFDSEPRARRHLRATVLVVGWAELALVVLPLLWVFSHA